MRYDIGGMAEIEFAEAGLRATLTLPLHEIPGGDGPDAGEANPGSAPHLR
jgi:hypothetical protein